MENTEMNTVQEQSMPETPPVENVLDRCSGVHCGN